jgi:photosystem II stability/assembly factor-like uncharacterized protein
MSSTVFTILAFLLSTGGAQAQLLPQWIVSGRGQFTGFSTGRGIDGCAGGFFLTGGRQDNDFVLQVSDDGGLTWEETLRLHQYGFGAEQPPVRRAFAELVINGVARPAPETCFAYGWGSMEYNGVQFPLLLRSNDSGRTWVDIELPDSARGINEGWIAMRDARHGVRNGGYIDEQHSVLYRTTDGGDSWTTFDIPFVDYRTMGLEYATDGALFAVEWRSYPPLFRSTDDGVTWEERAILPASRTPYFHDAELGWMAYGERTGNGDVERDMIARTTDGGLTWQSLMDTLQDPPFGLIAIAAATEKEVIAVGRIGKLLHSHDGGESWERAPVPFYLYDPATAEIAYPDTTAAVAGALRHIITYTGERTLPSPVVSITHGAGLLEYEAQWTSVPGATDYQLEMTKDYHSGSIQYEIFDTDPYMQGNWMPGTSLELEYWLQVNRDYFVRVRARGAGYTSDWSAPVKFYTDQSTAVDPSIPETFSLSVYPQPSRSTVNMTAAGLQPGAAWTLQITDHLGRRHIDRTGRSSTTGAVHSALDLQHLPAGTYWLRFTCGAARRILPVQVF